VLVTWKGKVTDAYKGARLAGLQIGTEVVRLRG